MTAALMGAEERARLVEGLRQPFAMQPKARAHAADEIEALAAALGERDAEIERLLVSRDHHSGHADEARCMVYELCAALGYPTGNGESFRDLYPLALAAARLALTPREPS